MVELMVYILFNLPFYFYMNRFLNIMKMEHEINYTNDQNGIIFLFRLHRVFFLHYHYQIQIRIEM